MDEIRKALEKAERDLDVLKVIRTLSPHYQYSDGSTVSERIAAKLNHIQELKRDLMGNC